MRNASKISADFVDENTPKQTTNKRKNEESEVAPDQKRPRVDASENVQIEAVELEEQKPGPSADGGVNKDDEEKQLELQKAKTELEKKEHREFMNRRYRYGNYNRYYGSRLKNLTKDPRLDKFPRSWFEHKSVLDIGCNVGFLSLELAKNFGPRRVLGIDIDDTLVGVARKNIRHYCDKDVELIGKYPASFAQKTAETGDLTIKFPDNVWFRPENYVLAEDFMLECVTPEFDVILALSITKWIHLNFGDGGMKRFFQRAFLHLRPGGRFIVEPQEWNTYKKRSRLTPEIAENYKNIKFKPDQFEKFLTEEVGFMPREDLGVPEGAVKGFDRPLHVYRKKPHSFKS